MTVKEKEATLENFSIKKQEFKEGIRNVILHRPTSEFLLLKSKASSTPFFTMKHPGYKTKVIKKKIPDNMYVQSWGEITTDEFQKSSVYCNHKVAKISKTPNKLEISDDCVYDALIELKHGVVKGVEDHFDRATDYINFISEFNNWLRGNKQKISYAKPFNKLRHNLTEEVIENAPDTSVAVSLSNIVIAHLSKDSSQDQDLDGLLLWTGAYYTKDTKK